MKILRTVFGLALALVLAACSFPGSGSPSSAEMVQTAAASTVSAQLTESALLQPTATFTPLPTETQTATETPSVTNTPFATQASGGTGGTGSGVNPACDSMAFVTDVTVPDGTNYAPGATFTKTWRIRNAGTCSWSTAYSVVFSSGAAMGGPATQPLTATIAPNSTMDVSVNLTAPSAAGSHTGYWMLRNASGQTFGSFYVVINVTGSGGTGSGQSVTLQPAQTGQVTSGGAVQSARFVGSDNGADVQFFASYDLSSIPANATITQVSLTTPHDMNGNPFDSGSCLRLFSGSFFPLAADDYNAGGGHIEAWCSSSDLATAKVSQASKALAQSAIGGTLQYRFGFQNPPTNNTRVNFLNSSLQLTITYTTPAATPTP